MKSEELESHMIRASIDMRIPNQSMKRSRCVQSPRVEDFIYRLYDCKIFTKLDLRQGYHQLALDPSTRQVATISTPWGNYRPQRLVFGAKSWQDVFDEAMFRIFSQFKLANADINTTDEPEKNERVETQIVPDIETPEKETPPSAPPDPPDTTANAEKPMERPGSEVIPEQETKPEQGAEHNQPVDRPAATRPRRERRQPSHLKDYVLD